jgi:hypothetical protein
MRKSVNRFILRKKSRPHSTYAPQQQPIIESWEATNLQRLELNFLCHLLSNPPGLLSLVVGFELLDNYHFSAQMLTILPEAAQFTRIRSYILALNNLYSREAKGLYGEKCIIIYNISILERIGYATPR